jgi:2-C-methyl-D-erythritol 2,4-cyclodiphosphate synthase
VTQSRVGFGFDVHPFSDDPDRPLVLGGVTLDGGPGLAGHSDADVVAHAVADALLGPAGLGDLGTLFPDTEPAWQGADSLRLLAAVVQQIEDAGWSVSNVDCAVVAEAPRLAPHREEMQRRLSEVVGAPVTVKPKRAEGLGALGRREGIACHAVALIHRADLVTPANESARPPAG